MKNKIRVFLVDDNNFDNYYHRKIIEKFNSDIEVQIFDSAEDALLYLNIIPINNFPNYIFLDINLPGFNGWDFLKYSFDMMITEKPDCKIIMLTT